MKETIFTKIVKGEIPSTKIYEDNETYAFLDIKPNNLGHVLVIPKYPYENIYEIPDEMLLPLMKTVKNISIAVKKGLDADGINIAMNNGSVAGQEVMHAHIHIIPRFKDDGFFHGRHLEYKNGEIEEIVKKIKNHL